MYLNVFLMRGEKETCRKRLKSQNNMRTLVWLHEHQSKHSVRFTRISKEYTYNILNNLFDAVEGTCKVSGVSILAKSLFASLPQQMSKEGVLFPKQDDDFLTDHSRSYKLGNAKGEFHEFHKAFNTQSHHHLSIGLHMF